jgi:hypothetical protein
MWTDTPMPLFIYSEWARVSQIMSLKPIWPICIMLKFYMLVDLNICGRTCLGPRHATAHCGIGPRPPPRGIENASASSISWCLCLQLRRWKPSILYGVWWDFLNSHGGRIVDLIPQPPTRSIENVSASWISRWLCLRRWKQSSILSGGVFGGIFSILTLGGPQI